MSEKGIRNNKTEYDRLLLSVGATLEQGRQQAAYAVNSAMVQTYWEIGRQIVEYEQHGNEKAEYGSGLLNQLSKDLTIRYGGGFSLSNINKMRKMYLTYPILQTLSAKLTWSHYVELFDNLSMFFLELGKGFIYVGRQQKIVIGGRTYKADLVFYHRVLKCFVLIDLKRGEVQHEDIGQMNFYLNYYRDEMNTEGDTEPIGIILGAHQDKLVLHYALQNITNQVFVSRDQLYLPDREQLESEFKRFMSGEETAKQ